MPLVCNLVPPSRQLFVAFLPDDKRRWGAEHSTADQDVLALRDLQLRFWSLGNRRRLSWKGKKHKLRNWSELGEGGEGK